MDAKFTAKIDAVEALADSLSQNLFLLESKVAAGGAIAPAAVSRDLELQNEVQSWRTKHEDQYRVHQDLMAKYNQISLSHQEMTRAHDSHAARALELEQSHRALQQEIEALTNQNSAHVQNIQSLTVQLQQPMSPPKATAVDSGGSAREVELSAALLEARGERDHWQNQHGLVISQHEQVLADMQHWQAQHQQASAQALHWETQHQQVSADMQNMQAQYERAVADLQQVQMTGQESTAQYQQAVAEAAAHREALQLKDAELMQMGALNNKVVELEQMIALKQQEVDLVSQQLNEVSASKAIIEQDLLLNKNTAGDLQTLMGDMSTMEQYREGLEKDVQSLNERLTVVSQMGPTHEAHQDIQSKYTQVSTDYQDLLAQHNQAKEIIVQLEQAQALQSSLSPSNQARSPAPVSPAPISPTGASPLVLEANNPAVIIEPQPLAAPIMVTEQVPVMMEQQIPVLAGSTGSAVQVQSPSTYQVPAAYGSGVSPGSAAYALPAAYGMGSDFGVERAMPVVAATTPTRTMSIPAKPTQYVYTEAPRSVPTVGYSAAANTLSMNATRYTVPTPGYAMGQAVAPTTSSMISSGRTASGGYGEAVTMSYGPAQSASVTAPMPAAGVSYPLPANRIRRQQQL